MSEVAAALKTVRGRIEDSCARCGRAPGSVSLVAVTKTVPAEAVREMLRAGHDVFGENRVQEALRKMEQVGGGARWHLVGHLQSNKARHAVGAFELIHSLDGLPLAEEIDRRAAARGARQAVLVQVNLSREPTKSGVDESGARRLIEAILGLAHLDLRGLMTIPPPSDAAERSRPWFARLRELRDRIQADTARPLPELSMGMTDDFDVAIEEGATIVRIGRALFGERE